MTSTKNAAIPEPQKKKNTAIYCRVSTSAFDQLHSLNNQMEGLMDFIIKNPFLKFYDVYVDVSSGRGKYERRNLKRLMRDCASGKVQYVVTKSISRFYRDAEYLLQVTRELKKYQVEIFFLTERIGSFEPESELYLAIYGAVAQSESDGKSANIKWGIEKARDNPDSGMNNKKFFGYKHGSDGKLIIDEEQAVVVRKIFKWYINGESIVKIIQHLSDEKIPSPRGNAVWSKKAVENIISREEYTGMKRLVKGNQTTLIKEHHEGIVSITEFLEAKEKKAKRSNIEIDADGNQVRKKKRYQSPS